MRKGVEGLELGLWGLSVAPFVVLLVVAPFSRKRALVLTFSRFCPSKSTRNILSKTMCRHIFCDHCHWHFEI